MAKRKQQVEGDMRLLITAITGLEVGDENFDLCVNFSKSNFKYHRFLSPDSHKLERAVEGLCEKLEVHSQHEKAVALKEMVESFLQLPGLDGKEVGKTDVHYAVLSLLLELADSPTKTHFEKKVKDIVEEPVDTFDWAKYLLDSVDLNFMSYASSDSEEDEETLDDGDDDDVDKNDVSDNRRTRGNQSSVQSDKMAGDDETLGTGYRSHDLSRVSQEDESARLDKLLVVRYWEGRSVEETCAGDHNNSNLIRDWNAYKRQMNEFDCPVANVVVTETQIIRETLWILMGIPDSFIFKHSGKEFSLNPDVYVMHLSTESLECSLRPLMRKANQVHALSTFVSDLVAQNCGGDSGAPPPQTYQAFGSCVFRFLSDFKSFLVGLEQEVMRQEKLITLDKLTSNLRPWLPKLQAVHGVYICGVAQASHHHRTANNCVKATALLDTLYESVFESDLLCGVDGEGVGKLLLRMLIACSEPLLRIASDWVNCGHLMDPAGEFVLHRNTDIKSLDETFWEKAFVSNLNQDEEDDAETAATTESQPLANVSASSQRSGTLSSSIPNAAERTVCVEPAMYPKFLGSVLGKVILTGKSMEMLENLGRMEEALEIGANLLEQPQSLFNHFLMQMGKKLNSVSTSLSKEKILETETADENSAIVAPTKTPNLVSKQLLQKGEKDTLLHLNFSALFSPEGRGDKGGPHAENNVAAGDSTPIKSQVLRMCEESLGPYVASRYSRVCSRLLHILKSEYNLVQCIHAMQRYFLMSSGEVMYDFYRSVFLKIQKREMWKDSDLLEMFLHEAVDGSYPEDTTRLSVSVVPLSRSQTEHAISETDCIQLKYQVPWPVDVVISSSCQDQYNDIFNFLLQIKRSKFTLEQLKFEELSKKLPEVAGLEEHPCLSNTLMEDDPMTVSQRLHRFQLLKFRLLYFVNSLHNYMMTRILHSTGLKFSEQLSEATDLEQVIQIHRNYVGLIHDRCLLHPKLAFLKKAVCQVLNLSLTCSSQWRRGIQLLSGEAVCELELEVSRCVHFLSSFLNNVIKRGSFPHLESLAFALVSSLQNVPQGP